MAFFASGQNDDAYLNYIDSKSKGWQMSRSMDNDKYYSNDSNIDIHHYSLKLKPSLNSNWLEGQVCITLSVIAEKIDSFKLDLAPELQIDSFSWPIARIDHKERQLSLMLSSPAFSKEQLSFCLDFSGEPALLNGIKGLHYKLENENNPLVVSLSTPYLAHQWWPCKDGPEDKADSMSMEIIIPSKTPSGKILHAVSNGVLQSIDPINAEMVAFRWRHSYPIVPYYIMVAIAPYATFSQEYTSVSGQELPLEYYVFDDQLELSKDGVRDLPAVLNFFESIFGPYPFAEEKYGMTQIGFYGGIENQTNSIMNRMTPDYFRVTVHELAHMWFGDMITCTDWHDAWLNEGFASYAECLWEEYSNGTEAYHQCLESKRYHSGGTIYLQSDNDPFDIFKTIIYFKGAWLLHMLRHIVGEDLFFEIIKNYAQDPNLQYRNASSWDFINHVNLMYNKDLSSFFNQWLYHEYFPVFEYNYEQDDAGNVSILIDQIQQETYPSAPVFEIPVDIKLHFSDGTDSSFIIEASDIFINHALTCNKNITGLEIDPGDWVLCKKIFNPGLTSTSEVRKKHISLAPNPFQQNEHLNIWGEHLTDFSILEIWDMHGKILHHESIKPVSGNFKLSISTLNFPPGTYYFVLKAPSKAPKVIKAICIP
jgi:aminopeptidase N